MILRKELDEEEDKGRNSVTTTQSHWRDDPTFTQIYVCRGLEAENISQDLKTIMIIKMYLSEICFGRVLFTYASGRRGWHTQSPTHEKLISRDYIKVKLRFLKKKN